MHKDRHTTAKLISNSMAITVTIFGGSAGDYALTFDGTRIVIGRGAGCDVRIPDLSVSVRHASLRVDAGAVSVFDEGSTNGTWISGVRISDHTTHAVRSNARIAIGRIGIEIQIAHAAPTRDIARASRDIALTLVQAGLDAIDDPTEPADALAEIESSEDVPLTSIEIAQLQAPALRAQQAEKKLAESESKAAAPIVLKRFRRGWWTEGDSAVALSALAILALSVIGLIWVLTK